MFVPSRSPLLADDANEGADPQVDRRPRRMGGATGPADPPVRRNRTRAHARKGCGPMAGGDQGDACSGRLGSVAKYENSSGTVTVRCHHASHSAGDALARSIVSQMKAVSICMPSVRIRRAMRICSPDQRATAAAACAAGAGPWAQGRGRDTKPAGGGAPRKPPRRLLQGGSARPGSRGFGKALARAGSAPPTSGAAPVQLGCVWRGASAGRRRRPPPTPRGRRLWACLPVGSPPSTRGLTAQTGQTAHPGHRHGLRASVGVAAFHGWRSATGGRIGPY